MSFYKVGDMVNLTDGTKGEIEAVFEDGGFTVAVEGEYGVRSVRADEVVAAGGAAPEGFRAGDQVNTPQGIGTITDLVDDEVIVTDLKGDEWMVPLDKISKIKDGLNSSQPTAPVDELGVIETDDGTLATFAKDILNRVYERTVTRRLAVFYVGDITKNQSVLNAFVKRGELATCRDNGYVLTEQGTKAVGGDWLTVQVVRALPQSRAFDGETIDAQRLLAQVFDQLTLIKHDRAELETRVNSLQAQVERLSPLREENGRLTLKVEKLERDLAESRNTLPPLTEVTVLKTTNEKLTKELESLKIINQKIANSTTGKLHAQLAEANAEIARLRLFEQHPVSAPAADAPVIAMDATPVKVEMQFITTNYLFPEEVKRLEDAVNNDGWSMVYETVSNGVHVARLERDIDDGGDDEPGEPIVKQAPAVNPGAFSDFVNTLDLDDDAEALHVEGDLIIAEELEAIPTDSQRLIEAGHETGYYDTGAILGALANELRVKHEQRMDQYGS